MATYYTRTHDQWRPFAYRRAIATLRRHPTRITNAAEASTLPHIGTRLALKIEEIVHTDRLRRLDNANADSDLDPSDRAVQLFQGVFGVGFAQASLWARQGHRSLEDLQARATLSPCQTIGVAHCADFNTRIPRAEVEALGAYVRRVVKELDGDVDVLIMGSYRRGAQSSGDIDLILTRMGDSVAPKTAASGLDRLRAFLHDELVPRLFEVGFLKAGLQVSAGRDRGSKWLGACALPVSPAPSSASTSTSTSTSTTDSTSAATPVPEPIWRRIDLLLVPRPELGAATLYFTGNDIFNRSIRLLASKKGYCLNQRGLWRHVLRGPGRKKVNSGELEEAADERRIFDVLGVPWREVWERDA